MSAVRVEHIGAATLYLGRCEDVLPTLGPVDAVVTDPPYGIGKAEWDDKFLIDWFDDAAEIANTVAIMPGTWNLMRLPQQRGGLTYKWTLSAHLVNGMTKGGFGWGNWIPLVVYRRDIDIPLWCATFSKWCKAHGISRREIDRVCGTSDMGNWYLSTLAHRCRIPTREHWSKISSAFQVPNELVPILFRSQSDYNPVSDCRGFVVGTEPRPDHPSPKPLNVMEWFLEVIDCHSIVDPFMGSGTTGVACARLCRQFIGIECNERYFDIACRRIEAAQRQSDLFIAPAPVVRPVTVDMFGDVA